MRTPAVFCAWERFPEAMATKSPAFKESSAKIFSFTGETNFEMPPTSSPFSSTRNQ